jgi:ABC-2 type transport system permease protein
MVGVFARLKLTLLRNSLRRNRHQVVGLVTALTLSVPLVVVAFTTLAAVGHLSGRRLDVAIILFSALPAGWTAASVLFFGVDETLDPSLLLPLPLSRGELMRGVLVTSMVGIAPLAVFIALSGAIVGFGRSAAAVPFVMAAVVCEFLLGLVGARLATTLLSAALRSRRGRDLSALLFALLVVTISATTQGFLAALRNAGTTTLRPIVRPLGWLPPGWAARAMDAAASHRWGASAGFLVLVACVLGAMLWAWAAALDRLGTTAEPQARVRASQVDLFAVPLGWLPRSRAGAIAAKELRYLWREPRRRVNALLPVLIALLALVAERLRGGRLDPHSVLFAASVALLGSGTFFNQFGTDGQALWANVAAGEDAEADLLGKGTAAAVFLLAAAAVMATALAAISGGWIYLPVALGLTAGVAGAGLAMAAVLSVRAPFPMPDARNLFAAGGSGAGCAVALLQLLGLAGQVVLAVPVAALTLGGLRWSALLLAAVTVVGPVYGYLVFRAGIGRAARFLQPRHAELLDAVSPRRKAA